MKGEGSDEKKEGEREGEGEGGRDGEEERRKGGEGEGEQQDGEGEGLEQRPTAALRAAEEVQQGAGKKRMPHSSAFVERAAGDDKKNKEDGSEGEPGGEGEGSEQSSEGEGGAPSEGDGSEQPSEGEADGSEQTADNDSFDPGPPAEGARCPPSDYLKPSTPDTVFGFVLFYEQKPKPPAERTIAKNPTTHVDIVKVPRPTGDVLGRLHRPRRFFGSRMSLVTQRTLISHMEWSRLSRYWYYSYLLSETKLNSQHDKHNDTDLFAHHCHSVIVWVSSLII